MDQDPRTVLEPYAVRVTRLKQRAHDFRRRGARPAALADFVPAWEELAAAAIEPNVFYEHWMLLPALRAFGAGKNIYVVLVLIHDPHNPDAPAKLVGCFRWSWTPASEGSGCQP